MMTDWRRKLSGDEIARFLKLRDAPAEVPDAVHIFSHSACANSFEV
jgi:hypothetical protein